MLLSVVKGAFMFLCIPVLATENVVTLAGEPEESNLSLAEPAGILV